MSLDDKRSLIAIQGPKSVKILSDIINGVENLSFMSGNWFLFQEQKTYKEEVPENIFVTLKGTGRSFMWLRLFNNFYNDDFKAVIDLSSITDEYNFELDSYYKENPEKIVLPASLDLQFVEVLNPRNVQIKLQRYMVKKVPIQSQIFVSTEPGYIDVGVKFCLLYTSPSPRD